MLKLFNKYNNGSIELQQATGIFSAANDFSSIEGEINFAIKDVANQVGIAVITKASELYLEKDEIDPLTQAVRTPVAILAVLRYSMQTLVSHDDTGRKIKTDGNDKIAFAWMIDRDDRAMQDKYYRAMDALYYYLENNNVEEFITSNCYNRVKESIIKTIDEFERVYPLDNSYYAYYMFQNLVIEGQTKIKSIIGLDKWESLCLLNEENQLLILIKRYLILYAITTGVKRWSIEVLPLSIAKRFSPSFQGNKESKTASSKEIEQYLSILGKDKDDLLEDIKQELRNSSPEQLNLLPDNNPENKYFTAL